MPSRTITNAAEELFPQNALRKSFAIENEDTSIQIFIKKERPTGLTCSTTDHDHNVRPGATIAVNYDSDGKEAVQERWTIVAASGTPRISFVETEEIKR
jgi:hypothetical protein